MQESRLAEILASTPKSRHDRRDNGHPSGSWRFIASFHDAQRGWQIKRATKYGLSRRSMLASMHRVHRVDRVDPLLLLYYTLN